MNTHPLHFALQSIIWLHAHPARLWPARIAWYLSLALGFWLAMLPVSELPVPTFNDKLVHAAGVGGLTLAAGLLHVRTAPAQLAGLLTLYGLVVEMAQALVPWRSASVGDLAADALGAALAAILLSQWSGRRQIRSGV